MDGMLGATLGVFIGLTVVVMGGCAFMMGQGVAQSWKPEWMIYVYSVCLGLADRFLVFALFQGQLLSLHGFIVHTAVIAVIAFVAFRTARAHRMVQQYPWLYVRTGPFTWKDKPGGQFG